MAQIPIHVNFVGGDEDSVSDQQKALAVLHWIMKERPETTIQEIKALLPNNAGVQAFTPSQPETK